MKFNLFGTYLNICLNICLSIFLIICFFISEPCVIALTDLEKEAAGQWFSKGKFFYENKKDLLKAAECFNRALEVNPNHNEALEYTNKIRKQLGLEEKVRTIDKDNSRGWFMKGRYLCDFKKDYANAIRAFEKALVFDPSNSDAARLLEITRKRVEYSLDQEHSFGLASEEFMRASKFLGEKDFVSALNAYKKGFDLFKNNTQALFAYFRTAQRLGQKEDIYNGLNLLESQVKFGLITRFDIENIVKELECFKNRLNVELAYKEYNRDKEILELVFDNFSFGFFKKIPKEMERYNLAFKKMKVLDLKLLEKTGYLEENSRCSSSLGIYFLNDMGHVECTVHGITSNTISADTLKDKDYLNGSHADSIPADSLRGAEKAGIIDELALKKREVIKSREVYNAAIALGDVNLENRDYARALENYNQAVRIDPSDCLGYIKRGNVLYVQKNIEDALAAFMDACDKDPYSFEAWNNIGNCRADLKNIKEAVAAYKKALEIKPDYFEANYNLGYTLLKNNKPQEAENYFIGALKIDPEDFSARYYLANSYIEMDKFDKALAELKIIKNTVQKGSSLERIVSALILKISRIRKFK